MSISNIRHKLIGAGLIAIAGLCAPASATIINISALNGVGTTQNFGPGTYTVTYAGASTAGAIYNAWNPWGQNVVSGCNGSGESCSQGWSNDFAIRSSSFTGGGSIYANRQEYFSTPAQALTAYQTALQSGGLVTALLSNASNPADYSPLIGPITFTLTGLTAVNFFIVDSPYSDNAGGVSLSVSSGVPEPSTWVMMLIGFAGLGFAGYSHAKTARSA